MTSDGVVTLRTGFVMAHGDYEAVMVSIKDYNMSYSCFGRMEIMRKILDPNHEITGSTRFDMIEAGILDDQGNIPENIKQIILAALPVQGTELAKIAETEGCPIMVLKDCHILAR
jgi:hypothetical protein